MEACFHLSPVDSSGTGGVQVQWRNSTRPPLPRKQASPTREMQLFFPDKNLQLLKMPLFPSRQTDKRSLIQQINAALFKCKTSLIQMYDK